MIHVVDEKTNKILAVLSEEDFYNDEYEENLKGVEKFKFFMSALHSKAGFFASRRRIVIPGEDGEFKEFILQEPLLINNTKEIHTVASYTDLRKQKIIDPIVLEGQTAFTAGQFVLDLTKWQLGTVEFGGTKKVEFPEPLDAYEALWEVAKIFGLELRFRVEKRGSKIVGRYVDMVKRRGELSGKEVVFGKDIEGIDRHETAGELVTALKCYGPVREDGSRLMVIVEDEEAFQRWNDDGAHLWGKYEPQTENSEMTEERLRTLGEMELAKRISTQVQYKLSTIALEHIYGLEHEKVRLGDTNRVKDESKNPPIYLDARVISIRRSIKKRARKFVEYGDFIEYTREEVMGEWKKLQAEFQRKLAQLMLVSITSSAGNIFKNGEGSTVLTVNTFLGGAEYDMNGTIYTYQWTKRDKDGNVDASFNKTGKSITVTSADVLESAAFSAEVSMSGTVLQKSQITVTDVYDGEDGDPGSDAKLLYLSTTSDVMTFNADGTPNPSVQTISLTANLQNMAGTATFTAIPYNSAGTALTAITLGGTGNTRTLNQAQWPSAAARVVVTATLSGLTDTVTITQLRAGAKGDAGNPGEDAIVGFLTNESITLGADTVGNVGDFSKATGIFEVYDGLTRKTGSGVTYAKTAESGCTASINTTTGVYSVSAMSADTATATFTATYSSVTITKVLSLAKSKTGSKGDTGPAGKGVASIQEQYYLSTSATSQTGGSWSSTPPAWVDGRYMWTRSVITYTDNSTTTTNPVNVTGGTGGTGSTGKGVTKVDVWYYKSTSATSLTGGTWSTTAPAWENGKYIWSKTIITYTDGTTSETQPACITGQKGDKGDKGDPGAPGTPGKDGIAHMGTTAPTNPGVNATWFKQDSTGKIIGIFKWTGDEWLEYQMTQDVLNVTNLAAIVANLGTITAGTLTGVKITVGGTKGTVTIQNDEIHYVAPNGWVTKIQGAEVLAVNTGYSQAKVNPNGLFVDNLGNDLGGASYGVETLNGITHAEIYADKDIALKAHGSTKARVINTGILLEDDNIISTADRGWIAPTLLNGVTNYGSVYETAGYKKNALGDIQLKGFLTGSADGKHLFTLPDGYRPSKLKTLETWSNSSSGIGRVTVDTDGKVIATISGNWISLDGKVIHL